MKNIVFIVLVRALNRLDSWEDIADFADTVPSKAFISSFDVVFGADTSLKSIRNSVENFNIVWKVILGMLRNDGIDYGKKKVSLRRRMLRATRDEEYLENLLQRL